MVAWVARCPSDRRATGPTSRPHFASGKFHRNEDGSRSDIGTLRTGTVLLGLEGPVVEACSLARRDWARSGTCPADREGIFLSGGRRRFLAGGGIDYRRPLLAKWDLMTSARYDFHRFRTGTLEARGFSQSPGVSRVSLSVGLSRGVR